MPLYKTIIANSNTTILVWKITESLESLSLNSSLSAKSQNRLKRMKSEVHQRGFLAVRKLLETANYTDHDLFYDDSNKPHLIDNQYISISHSHQFATIIISNNAIGIDIEKQREKIISIANKFINIKEYLVIKSENMSEYIKNLTIIWGAKEAVFKVVNKEGISFKNHIIVENFDFKLKKASALLRFNDLNQTFSVYFEEIDDFVLVYCL